MDFFNLSNYFNALKIILSTLDILSLFHLKIKKLPVCQAAMQKKN
jgi:hypothetical protein